MKQLKFALLVSISLTLLSGCMNMPTPPSQITSSYTSGLRYLDFDCQTLSVEMDSLARRQNQLVVAQEQRIKTSKTQAFWYGFGQGDGIEAVRTAMEKKSCDGFSKSAIPK